MSTIVVKKQTAHARELQVPRSIAIAAEILKLAIFLKLQET